MRGVLPHLSGALAVTPTGEAVPESHLPETVFERALGSREESTSTTHTTTATTSPNTISITGVLFPSANSSQPASSRRGVSQTVLMWVFAVIALGLLTLIIIWRYTCVKYRNSRLNARRERIRRSGGGGGSQTLERPLSARLRDPDFQNTWDRQARPIVLSPSFLHTGLMPLVNQEGVLINELRRGRGQRVRAADVDEGGRRGGGINSELEEGDIGDELPAYEADKGPPGYHFLGFERRPSSRSAEARSRSPEREQHRTIRSQEENVRDTQGISAPDPPAEHVDHEQSSSPRPSGPVS